MQTTNEDLLRKLRYRSCYRGCKESDHILGQYVNAYLHTLNDYELEIYSQFLLEEDVNIMDWVMGKQPWPEAYGFILERIKPIIA